MAQVTKNSTPDPALIAILDTLSPELACSLLEHVYADNSGFFKHLVNQMHPDPEKDSEGNDKIPEWATHRLVSRHWGKVEYATYDSLGNLVGGIAFGNGEFSHVFHAELWNVEQLANSV